MGTLRVQKYEISPNRQKTSAAYFPDKKGRLYLCLAMLYQGMFENRSRRCQAGILVLLFAAGFLLSLFPLLLLQIVASDPTLPPVARASVVIQDVCLFIMPPLMGVLLLFKQPALQVLSLRTPHIGALVGAILVMLLLTPLINLTASWNQAMELPQQLQPLEEWMKEMEQQANYIVEQMLGDARISVLILNLLIIALLAGVSEELLFRGFLMKLIYRWISKKGAVVLAKSPELFSENTARFHAAVWITALLFSAIHLQFYGFLPRLLLGATLGYLCAYGGLWASILAHTANNTMAILLYPEQPYNAKWEWVRSINESSNTLAISPIIIVACSLLAIGIIIWMKKSNNKHLHKTKG